MSDDKFYYLPVKEIYSDPEFNCRGAIAPYDVIDLARSIAQSGLQQAIVVQPYTKVAGKLYRIVMGHRRFQACIVNKMDTVKSTINPNLNDEQARILNLQENLQRKDLNLLQEARALEKFLIAGKTMKDIAKDLNVSSGWVQVRISLLELDEKLQNEAAAGVITQEHIKDLVSIDDPEERYRVVREIKDRKERGEKSRIKIKDLTDQKRTIKEKAKKFRDRGDLLKLQTYFRETVGNGIVTRIIGWTCGELTTEELAVTIMEHFEELSISPEVPPIEFLTRERKNLTESIHDGDFEALATNELSL